MSHLVVRGFKPPDEKWRQMKDVYEACRRAGLDVPEKVAKFFNYEGPCDHGVLIDEDALGKMGVLTEWVDREGGEKGFDIRVDKIHPDVKVVRVSICW